MELTPAHLRYLLAIYEVSQTHLDISSRSIAEKLGVTKPSVVRVHEPADGAGDDRQGVLRQDLPHRPGHLRGPGSKTAAGRGACTLPAGGGSADR